MTKYNNTSNFNGHDLLESFPKLIWGDELLDEPNYWENYGNINAE